MKLVGYMGNGLGITLKSFVCFEVTLVAQKFVIYDRKMHDRMLTSCVEINS